MSEQRTPVHEDNSPPQAGRSIVLTPVPAGSWPLMLGLALAGLGPLGGFLAGSMVGIAESPAGGGSAFSAIYLYLFIGIAIGAIGVLMAGFGGARLYRGRRTIEEAEAPGTAA